MYLLSALWLIGIVVLGQGLGPGALWPVTFRLRWGKRVSLLAKDKPLAIANALATLLVAAYGVKLGFEVARRAEPAAATDFTQYYLAAQAILEGKSAYSGLMERAATAGAAMWIDAAPYPPVFELLVLPFALLPHDAGWYAWTALSLLMVGASLYSAITTLWPAPPRRMLILLLAGLALFPPLGYQLIYGNVSAVLLVAVTAIWLLCRGGRHTAAGVVLGATCALKPVPAPLFLYLLWQRNWRAVAGTAFGFFGFTALGALPLGPGEIVRYYREVLPQLNQFYAGIGNASFFGLGAKASMLLTETGLVAPSRGLELGTTLVSAALALAVVALALRACERRPTIGERVDAEMAAMTIAVLLASPISWPHYLIVLYLPLLIWLRQLSSYRPLDLPLLRALVVGTLLASIPSPQDAFIIDVANAAGALGQGAVAMATLAVQSTGCAALVVFLWAGVRRPPAALPRQGCPAPLRGAVAGAEASGPG